MEYLHITQHIQTIPDIFLIFQIPENSRHSWNSCNSDLEKESADVDSRQCYISPASNWSVSQNYQAE